MNFRLFIAIPLPENIKEEILNNTNLSNNYRITNKDNLHITLFFLGDKEENIIPKIKKIIDNIAKNQKAFPIELSNFGKFPLKGYPKIIYLTGDEGKNEIIDIADQLRKELKKHNITDDKDFNFHITVGRLKYKTNDFIKLPVLNNKIKFTVDRIILYKSDLKPQGAVYTILYQAVFY